MMASSSSLNNSTTTATTTTAKFANPKIISPAVHDYVQKLGYAESETAKALRLATASHARSVMMGDPLEAAFFGNVLLPTMGAKTVVEVGVFTGYSTLVMAQALPADGKVIALDVSREFTDIGAPYWKQAGVEEKIDLRIGPAVESLQSLLDAKNDDDEYGPNSIDFAFIDADKVNYKTYYELLVKLVKPNGIIAIDNVLWSGRVLEEDEANMDDDTKALREISQHVQQDERVEHVLLPFADGVTLVRKK